MSGLVVGAVSISATPEALASDCPRETQQVVMAVWSGGVVPDVDASDEMHRLAYSVGVTGAGPGDRSRQGNA